MIFIALKRLFNRAWLTVLSVIGVALAVGLVSSVPIFSQAVSFVMLNEELNDMSSKTGRPIFSIRVYALPSSKYTLSLEHCETIGRHIAETLVSEVGLSLITQNRHIETTGMVLRTRDEVTLYGEPNTFLRETKLAVVGHVAHEEHKIEALVLCAGESLTHQRLAVAAALDRGIDY